MSYIRNKYQIDDYNCIFDILHVLTRTFSVRVRVSALIHPIRPLTTMATAAAESAAAIQESPEALARIPERIVGERNARGIPSAVFVVRGGAWFPLSVLEYPN